MLHYFLICLTSHTISNIKTIKTIAINIGEPETPSYEELQNRIGQLIHGEEEWETFEVPKPVAKAGVWSMDLFGDPFIKPWMIDRADDHFELDISRAKNLLDWKSRHSLMDELPEMINVLKADPAAWYEKNKGHPFLHIYFPGNYH